jgi:hypothetical protein
MHRAAQILDVERLREDAVHAQARGVPLTLVDIDPNRADGLFTHRLLISRPDQHVAWRANEPPASPLALIDRLRGAAG